MEFEKFQEDLESGVSAAEEALNSNKELFGDVFMEGVNRIVAAILAPYHPNFEFVVDKYKDILDNLREKEKKNV